MRRTMFVLGVVMMTSGGCKKPESAPAAASASAAARPFAPIQPNDTALFAQLARERATRPADTPRTEQVLEALARAGLRVDKPSQFLGRTLGASYCAGGTTASGLGLSICEFVDGETAKRGREYSIHTFTKAFPYREIVVNQKTILTIVRPTSDGALGGQALTAQRVFSAL